MIDLRLDDFPDQTFDKLRYGDTDRQGHVNNAVFVTLCETGRVKIIHSGDQPLLKPGFSFVVARIAIDYRAELFWPGMVDIGTGIKRIGNSSVTFIQGLFQNGKCVAQAESVTVQVNGKTHRSAPLDDEVRARLSSVMMK